MEGGEGNKEYNENAEDYVGYDYAFPILSVWRLKEPIGMREMKERFGVSPPQRFTYLPEKLRESVDWREQVRILPREDLGEE